ncbi:MAG: L-serine ammonia-lyase, iron-sulfur-dependent, subunit alpha [Candidatus Izemoplasmatales bacterium]|jgi:L-cysteine desulfidase|nr:L-serine ammonia-lyase, iron-sulfur-dependent, subunit alpha [Candidatus Izemoplasmatales bacterium]
MDKCRFEDEYLKILQEELVPAKGCTEPVAIAFAGAKARDILGGIPDNILIQASGNLIKNIRCVTVPNTNNLVGIEASVLAGIVGGKTELNLEVIENITPEDLVLLNELLLKKIVKIKLLMTSINLHFILTATKNSDTVSIEIKNMHTNIVKIIKNDKVIFEKNSGKGEFFGVETPRENLTVENILHFTETVDINLIKDLLDKQIEYNMAIANKGLNSEFGVSIGQTILKHDQTIFGKIKAYSAAASEARMSGCSMPVMTNSGSGNQGIATSVPVVLFSEHLNISKEKMYRALILSNLLTIYQKSFIGRLSAFCGAISAAVSSGATFTYLSGGNLQQIKMTITNALANVSGVVCDGAKPSCASKISTGLDAAILGHFLAMENHQYNPLSGILKNSADETILAVGKIASEGMKDTDKVILDLMLDK